MASNDQDDLFEGDFGPRRRGSSSLFRPPSAANTKRVLARERAAWFNRSRGAPHVKLAVARPAGQQRVIVKLKPVVHAGVGGGGAGALMRHALYVEREGAGRDGDAVAVFDRELDQADGAAFVERCEGDRHHFRVIISPEYGGAIEDLKDYTRDLVAQVERDLDSPIDWIAAEHHDTGRPHIHLLMRGRRDDGRDLVIPRDYVSHGFRNRAEGLATERIGPRLEGDRREQAVKLERFTELDRMLVEQARGGELALAGLPGEGLLASHLMRRLNQLEKWGLAEPSSLRSWKLHADLETELTGRADRRERERVTRRLLERLQREQDFSKVRELEAQPSIQRVSGRVLAFESLGPDKTGPCLIGVESMDGALWTARVARRDDLRSISGVEPGAIVQLERACPALRASDRTIWEIAQQSGFDYSAALHQALRAKDRAAYIEMHVRRLEALRREGLVSRDRDGVFHLPKDYPARVLAREGRGGRESANVALIDPHGIEHQIKYPGPTWLDRLASGRDDTGELAHADFGKEMLGAIRRRAATLEQWGLGRASGEKFEFDPDGRERLAAMERDLLLKHAQDRIEGFARFAREGEEVQGLYVARIHAGEQSFALLTHWRDAILAPWRPEMDRALNQYISGRVTNKTLNFKFGRAAEKDIARSIGLER